MARQNPPVLWLTESACSCPEQPLSATHGRQRYNTLDFAGKVVCHETAGFIGCFLPRRALPSIGCLPPRERCPLWIPLPTGCSSPLLETQGQRNRHPFGILARFEMSTHKWKKVRGHSFQNAKIPQASLYQRGKPAGFSLLNYFSSGLLRSNPRINFRSGSTAEGVTDSSSSPIRRNVSVNVGSAPSLPQIPTQQPCRCPDSTVCRIIRRTAG